MQRIHAAAVATALLATGLAVPGGAAEDLVSIDDTPDHVVQVGAVADNPLKPYSYQDYFPRHLKVHQGDRVRWEFPAVLFDAAFHTVTFAPDRDALPFIRPDELPGTYAYGEGAFFTTGCGRPGQPVCGVDDPEEFYSSGTPIFHVDRSTSPEEIHPFDAVIDLPPGAYTYFCTVHEPAMEGTIEVVDDDVEVDNPTPEDFADHIAALTAEADALVAELSQPTPVDEGGQRTWTVHAGARTRDRGGVGIIGFLPASLTIRPGDAVRWLSRGEGDGVTFPDTGDHPLLAYFSFNCEYDDPAGGAPGVPLVGWAPVVANVLFGADIPCPAGGQLEMAVTPHAVEPSRAPGNAITSPATFHNSGFLTPPHIPDRIGRNPATGERFPDEFDATFPVPGTFPYRCQVHFDMMAGSVTVEGG